MAMTILCDQCGAKNPLGEIFCKTCGAKLDLEAIQQQLQERKETFTFDDFKHYFGIVRQVVVWILLAIVVLILVGLFLPVAVPAKANFDNQEQKAIVNKFQQVMAECSGASAKPAKEHVFSQQELTMMVNWMTGLDKSEDEDPGFALAPQEISVRLLSTQYVRLVLRSRAFKKMNVYSTLVGRFVEDDNGFRFVAVSAKVGKVSLPGMKDIVVKRFKPLFRDIGQLQVLSKKLGTVEVYDKQLVIKVKKKKKK